MTQNRGSLGARAEEAVGANHEHESADQGQHCAGLEVLARDAPSEGQGDGAQEGEYLEMAPPGEQEEPDRAGEQEIASHLQLGSPDSQEGPIRPGGSRQGVSLGP